jgi:hypothetical protein
MIACTYEDRKTALIGLKLLVLSLARHCPDLPLHVYCPQPGVAFEEWAGRQPNVCLLNPPSGIIGGWDVKPNLLLHRLNAGFDEVLWLDTDLVLTRDLRDSFGQMTEQTFVATEEHRWVTGHGTTERTERLGLPVGRLLPNTICSCVLRITSFHRPLLEQWHTALQRADYRKTQGQPFDERDWALGSDQDVLSGLLGSTRFASVPLRLLRSGREIAHCFCRQGYAVRDRLRNLLTGLPPLVHAQGPKPWELPGVLFAELSPYCSASLPFASQLSEPAPWLRPRTLLARILNTLAFGNPNLRDLPLVGWFEFREWWRRTTGRAGPTNHPGVGP